MNPGRRPRPLESASRRPNRSRPYRAVIFDLDGVITRTASLHARAWKRLFDEVLERRAEGQAPFDPEVDYRGYVDGKPRHDGIRSFLAARGIKMPEGRPDDSANAETVYGLGRRKNETFQDLMAAEGVEVYDDAVEQLRNWRGAGVLTAMVTSSRNGARILDRTGLTDQFDVRIDGIDADDLGLDGKPAPDIFLEAAARLHVRPEDAVVLEDAVAGVEAARRGGFGLVVGVARDGGADLAEHGADLLVDDVRTLHDLATAHD